MSIITTQKQIDQAQKIAMGKIDQWVTDYAYKHNTTKSNIFTTYLGVTESTYKRYVKGKSPVSLKFLLTAAKCMHLSVEELILDSKEEIPEPDETAKLWGRAVKASFPQMGALHSEQIGKQIAELINVFREKGQN